MWQGKIISVIIPCYNEAEGLRALLPRIPATIDEVIVVDNGSTDETAAVARAAGAITVSEPRRGYGRAIKTGFLTATGDILVVLDGDGTYHPYAIEYFVDILEEEGLGFISGNRLGTDIATSPASYLRYLGRFVFNVAAWLTEFRRFRDVLSGMWVLRRSVLPYLNVVADNFYFSQEVVLEAFSRKEFKSAEIPLYFHYDARRGQSKINILRHGLGGLAYFFIRRIRKSLGTWPDCHWDKW